MSGQPELVIVGGGMGDPQLLTGAARSAVERAQRVFAPPRLAESLRELHPGIQAMGIGEIRAALAAKRTDSVVVVSGDCGFFSLSSSLGEDIEANYRVTRLNGLSSLQSLCAKAGTPYDDVRAFSLHGRRGSAAGAVSRHRRTFFLTGGDNTVPAILRELVELGLTDIRVTVGEELSSPAEKITEGSPEELLGQEFSPLSAMLVENPRPAEEIRRLRDEDFLRGDVPMTKEAVRTLAVERLEIGPEDTVWDIGAGTGSVSVALARAARYGMVYAVERTEEGAELIRQNRARFGYHNLRMIRGSAPDALAELPSPDKVFLGGTGGRLREILESLIRRGGAVDVCLTAIALESLSEGLACLKELGYTDIEATSVNVATSRKAGNYHMMMAQNPVCVLSGRWRP